MDAQWRIAMNEVDLWRVPSPAHRGPGCPPGVELERWVVGEEVTQEVQRHVAGCGQCEAYVRALSNEQEVFRQRHPAEAFIAKLKDRPRTLRIIGWAPRLGFAFA